MAQLSPTVANIVDAEALALKLGLTLEALKENMAKGLVTRCARRPER